MKTSKHSLYFLAVAVGAILAVGVGFYGDWPVVSDYGVKLTESQLNASSEVVIGQLDTVRAKVTAFSSIECRTTYCRNHPERVGHQIALNAQYGHAEKVYIPAYGKTYDVIGTTDYLTDADIYFGTDQAGALEHGVKYLDIKIIK